MTSSGCKALPPPIIRTTSRPSRRNPLPKEMPPRKENLSTTCLELRGLPWNWTGSSVPSDLSKGPNLSALAAGLPTDLIVESVLSARPPNQGGLRDGHHNHQRRANSQWFSASRRQEGGQCAPDLARGEVVVVPSRNLASRSKAQTVMPPSLTDSLTRAELRDLIKYLSTLKNSGSPK